MYSTANLSDAELKESGNVYFTKRKYDDAVSCYTKAIVSAFYFQFPEDFGGESGRICVLIVLFAHIEP